MVLFAALGWFVGYLLIAALLALLAGRLFVRQARPELHADDQLGEGNVR